MESQFPGLLFNIRPQVCVYIARAHSTGFHNDRLAKGPAGGQEGRASTVVASPGQPWLGPEGFSIG